MLDPGSRVIGRKEIVQEGGFRTLPSNGHVETELEGSQKGKKFRKGAGVVERYEPLHLK